MQTNISTVTNIIDNNIEDLRGQDAPKHIIYYDYVYKLKTEPNSIIKLEKVTYGEVYGEYNLHLMNLNSKHRFIVNSTKMMEKLIVNHSGKTNFGEIQSMEGLNTSQVLSSFNSSVISSYKNDEQTNSLVISQQNNYANNTPIINEINDAQLLGYDTPTLPQNNGGFKHRHTIERIKKETETIPLRFENMPNKAFIKMFVDNLDMDENETKEFNKELANYVFEVNRKSIMDSIKEYYQMEKEVKRGRPSGTKGKRKKKVEKVEVLKNGGELICLEQ